MATSHITMDLQIGKNGTTESFYFNGDPGAAIIAGVALANKRILVLNGLSTVNEVFARPIDPAGGGTRQVEFQVGLTGQVPLTPDVHAVGANVKFRTASGFTARPYLHGLPDDWVVNFAGSAIMTFTGTAITALNQYLADVISLGMQLRGLSRDKTLTVPKRIQGISTVAGVTTMVAPGFDPGAAEFVILSRLKGYKVRAYDGMWRIESGSAGTYVISSPKSIDPNGFYVPQSGTVRRVVYAYETIASGTLLKPGTRRVGRVPNVSAGRQSARH